ncbi:PspC domain-containing protein [Pseudonocardia acidicola]|uniref:PspC domain-containing protein n=1 Tax=Pseudonocardia acidicola TaxID=2724939 RepID=A0ABX1SF04_9PSEU|nr:PspC domain-containing protein [Pseudonocardia acidicola]NMH99102.1 PspC domain-containing protein [Pseudonocardia acidicola]
MNGTDVQTTLREMWETRPARPRHDRMVAGVAAAIARRYDIDPVLVRIGFVVAAFYGIGAALYIAGWVLLPGAHQDDPTDGAGAGGGGAPGTRRSPNPVLLLGLVGAAIIGSGTFFGHRSGIILPGLAVAFLLFLLHRSRGQRGIAGPGNAAAGGGPAEQPTAPVARAAGTPAGPAAAGSAAADNAAGPVSEQLAEQPTEQVRATPPAWDPLGAAPFAWDLPEPSPPAPPPTPPAPRRSRVTMVTLALALLTGGVAGSLLLLGYGVTAVPAMLGTVLAVLGTGLVVGSFTRGGRGLIPIALLMCVLTWAAVSIPASALRSDWGGGVGELQAAPTATTAVAPQYRRGVGSIYLDLRNLDLNAPPGTDAAAAGPVRTQLSVGMGRIVVWIPQTADLTLHGSAGLGSVDYGSRHSGGPGATVNIENDPGTDSVLSGRPVVLDIEAGMGSVEVRRG